MAGKQGDIRPTTEQQAVLDHAGRYPVRGRKIVAFAGTGKTSTLKLLANQRTDPGIYLAYNKSIKLDAEKKFPRHIRVVTAHGAAFNAMRMNDSDQKERLNQKLFGNTVDQIVNMPRCSLPKDALGQIAIDTVAQFCNSADPELTIDHVVLDPREHESIRMAAYETARALWGRMSDRKDNCPITHDTYLKLWQLGDARLRGIEWGMFDEAQDASPVMLDVMQRQGIPITFVGDPHQQIYAWRGAVNAMRLVAGAEFPLTQSFRFGGLVADMANEVLFCKPENLRPLHKISGNPNKPTQIGKMPRNERHAFLSRTNAEWFQEALNFRGPVHVIGGVDEMVKLLNGAYGLYRTNERPMKVPAIARFNTWSALCEHTDRFDDRELLFARRIVEQFREKLPAAVADLLARHVAHEDDADLILSTAHKAKGREFDFVRLGGGFISPLSDDWIAMTPDAREAELNLLYVALTRAIQGLEPNTAVLDCQAIAQGRATPPMNGNPAVIPPPVKLQLIRIAKTDAPTEPVSPLPVQKTQSKAQPLPSSPPVMRPWQSEDDLSVLDMASKGFSAEDIAAWFDPPRSAVGVAVRMAVLGANGADPNICTEVLSALVPAPRAPVLALENTVVGVAAPRPSPSSRQSAKETAPPRMPSRLIPAPRPMTSTVEEPDEYASRGYGR